MNSSPGPSSAWVKAKNDGGDCDVFDPADWFIEKVNGCVGVNDASSMITANTPGTSTIHLYEYEMSDTDDNVYVLWAEFDNEYYNNSDSGSSEAVTVDFGSWTRITCCKPWDWESVSNPWLVTNKYAFTGVLDEPIIIWKY
jgi:hypothetical protein